MREGRKLAINFVQIGRSDAITPTIPDTMALNLQNTSVPPTLYLNLIYPDLFGQQTSNINFIKNVSVKLIEFYYND